MTSLKVREHAFHVRHVCRCHARQRFTIASRADGIRRTRRCLSISLAGSSWMGPPETINGSLVHVVQGTGPRGLEADYSDYREVGGIKIPYKWTFGWLDGCNTIELKQVQLNAPINASVCERPPAPTRRLGLGRRSRTGAYGKLGAVRRSIHVGRLSSTGSGGLPQIDLTAAKGTRRQRLSSHCPLRSDKSSGRRRRAGV